MKDIYTERLMYPELLQIWDNGEYTELYEIIKHTVNPRKTLLSEVKKNYYLYKVASVLGENEKADKHRLFVVENGGGLWYRKELSEQDCEKRKI